MGTARREAVSRATRLAGNGPVLVKRRNKANGRFTPRPKGASQVTWPGVAALEKGTPGPAPRAKRVQWVFSAGCVGMPHHLFHVTWDALYPSNLGCSTTKSLSENRKSTAEKLFWSIFPLIFVKYE